MARFRRRDTGADVETFRWTADARQAEDPVWLNHQARAGRVRYALSGTPSVKMYIECHGTELRAERGDWIVREASRRIYPIAPRAFERLFAALE